MAESTYFVQECPTCGRSLHIRVEYLGRNLVCQHCRGQLLARDATIPGNAPATSEANVVLLRRAEELLDLVEQRRSHPR